MNPMTKSSMIIFGRTFKLAFIITILFFGCKEDKVQPKPKSTSLNKIMPLGASRVEGARPEFESFRFELWKLLITEGFDVDYIGTQTDEASYDFDFPFDPDHEGRGGWTSGEIRDGIGKWLEAVGSPDIVLFSSPGGNDILNGLASFDQTVSNINEIIDILQENNPFVVIIIEELAPGKSSFMTPKFTADFEAIREEVRSIAKNQTTDSSTVMTVDMFTGFTDAMLADEVHYNEAGAKFIAERYYQVLLEGLLKME